jgi:hypothetical protein
MNIAVWSQQVSGANVSISVTTQGAGTIGGLQGVVQYNTSKLRLNSVTFASGWTNTSGDNLNWVLMNPNLPGAGAIATLNFTRLGTWEDGETAQVSLVNVKMSDGSTTTGANGDTATITYKAPVAQQPTTPPPTEQPAGQGNAGEGGTECAGGPEFDASYCVEPEVTETPAEEVTETVVETPAKDSVREFLDSPWAYGVGGLAIGVVATTVVFAIILTIRRERLM